jgi:uncharacterized membrane protein YecN with MAPEG domain
MDSIASAMGLEASVFVGPAVVTLAYCALYYVFMFNLMRVKLRLHREYSARDEKFDRYFGQDRELLAADRTQLNMLEHMPIFLVLLWLHAFLVSSSEAAILGAIYTGSRALYPILLRGRMGRDIPKRILFITFTGYGVLCIFGIRIAMNLL